MQDYEQTEEYQQRMGSLQKIREVLASCNFRFAGECQAKSLGKYCFWCEPIEIRFFVGRSGTTMIVASGEDCFIPPRIKEALQKAESRRQQLKSLFSIK